MIVRILGEGQYNVADLEQETLQGFDEQLEVAVDAGDNDRVHSSLTQLRDYIVSHGTPVADDYLGSSDIVVPYADADLDDINALLTDEGLIPNIAEGSPTK